MKKLLIAAGAVTGVVLLAKRHAPRGGIDFERLIERMPEDAPPKWMFRNMTAIRANTERILELLEAERSAGPAAGEAPAPESGAGPTRR